MTEALAEKGLCGAQCFPTFMTEALAEKGLCGAQCFPTFMFVLLSFTGRVGAGGNREVAAKPTKGNPSLRKGDRVAVEGVKYALCFTQTL